MKNIQGEALSTPMFKSMPTKNSSIDSRPHYRSDAFSTAYTKTFENDRIIMRGGGGSQTRCIVGDVQMANWLQVWVEILKFHFHWNRQIWIYSRTKGLTVPDKSSCSVTFIQTLNLEPKYTNYRTTAFFFQVLIHGSHIIVSRLSMDVDVQILTNPSLNSGQASKARYQVNKK